MGTSGQKPEVNDWLTDLTETKSPVLHSTSPIKHLARYIKCLIADNTEEE